MNAIKNNTDKIAALCGIIWFVLTIDACFTWFVPDFYRNFIGTIFVLFSTILLSGENGISLSKSRKSIFISVCILMLFMVFRFSVYRILIYLPLLCLIIWRRSALQKMYSYFRLFVLFYAIVSIFVEGLVLTKLWALLPTLAVFPPQNDVQEILGLNNYFYGFFSIPSVDKSLTFYRACGPLMEGGHFVFFLGFVYFVEMAIYGKRNIWLLICSILTLSPNCLIFLLITEAYCSFNQKKYLRSVKGFVGIPIGIIVLFFISPQFVKDQVYQIVLERTLENSLENMESDGVMALLDGRAGGNYSLIMYQQFLESNIFYKIFGYGESKDITGHMSDYRFLLMYCGYLGTLLIVWCTYCFSYIKNNPLFRLCVFTFAMVLFVQRSWMFMQVYVWIMMLLVTIKAQSTENNHARISEK